MKLLTKIRKGFSIKLTLYLFLGILFGSVLNWIWFNRTVSRSVRVSPPFCEVTDKVSLVSASDEITESRQNAIVRAAQKVGPAVVSISVVQTRTVREEPFFSPR
jgi:S1-C subfamily serine protease